MNQNQRPEYGRGNYPGPEQNGAGTPGQYPGGQNPAGQYSAGQNSAGQYPSGQYPPEPYQANQYQSGQYPGAQYPTGQPGAQYPGGQASAQYSAGQTPNPAGGYGGSPFSSPQPETKRKNGVVIAIVVAVLVLAVVILGVVYAMNKTDAADDATATTTPVAEATTPATTPAATPTPAAPTTPAATEKQAGGASGDISATTYDEAKHLETWKALLPLLYLGTGEESLNAAKHPDLVQCMAENTVGKISDHTIDAFSKVTEGDMTGLEQLQNGDPQLEKDGLAMLNAMSKCGVDASSLLQQGAAN
ncbi:hypothetical protein SAMN05421878_10185 [Actinobaculum suis]|uniref:Uncharacterized protein n=1 Tax=Actinobaculum suis TaxID=1657 RepID=A0A1G6ZEP6_9ACTO|nr:hypothetical protein [Actinobaculum suis]MDY5153910.1 hypothetical protein [Actinobaculum suis]SDE00962.1 hypothetical protein SAMN05421878_10185 [Actinobaculum suis]